MRLFETAGARAKVSSIHVNGWFGDYDKLAMTLRVLREHFGLDSDAVAGRFYSSAIRRTTRQCSPISRTRSGSLTSANSKAELAAEPPWVTEARGGAGFAELAARLLEAR